MRQLTLSIFGERGSHMLLGEWYTEGGIHTVFVREVRISVKCFKQTASYSPVFVM